MQRLLLRDQEQRQQHADEVDRHDAPRPAIQVDAIGFRPGQDQVRDDEAAQDDELVDRPFAAAQEGQQALRQQGRSAPRDTAWLATTHQAM